MWCVVYWRQDRLAMASSGTAIVLTKKPYIEDILLFFFFLVPALVMHSALPRDHWITIISTAVLINTVICHSCLYDFFLFAFALLFFSSSRVSLSFYVMSTALNPISRTLWAAHTHKRTHSDGTAAYRNILHTATRVYCHHITFNFFFLASFRLSHF